MVIASVNGGALTNRARVVVDAWLIALLFDKLAFASELATPLGVATLALSGWALLGGSRRWAAAAFSVDAVRLGLLMPDIANHLSLLILVDLVLVTYLARSSRGRVVDRELLQPLLALTVVLYSAAALHKANDSFLDASVTCAKVVLDQALGTFGGPESGPTLGTASIWLALGTEILLAALLALRRTRRVGVMVGLAFHGALAIHPHGGVSSFSVFMAALFIAFLADATIDVLSAWRRWLPTQLKDVQLRLALIVGVAILATSVSVIAPGAGPLASRPLGMAMCFSLLWMVVAAGSDGQATTAGVDSASQPKRPTLLTCGVVSIMLIAAALPYMGGRTQLAYSMFSNLRTEVDANHEFLPSVSWLGYQDDLVELGDDVSTIFDDVSGPGLSVPAYEVGRRLSVNPDIESLRFRSGGELFVLSGAELRERFPPPGWLEARLFRLRAVEPEGAVGCRH